MGKVLVNVTQCPSGCVNMNLYATGKPLLEAGTVSGYDATTESALAKLFHLLGICQDNERVKALFDMDLRGEITK
jgi:L-asparaginase